MTREDFARWKEDPVTRAVIAAYERLAEDNKEAWIRQSWDNGKANPLQLLELRTLADGYASMAQMTYENLCGAIGETPRDE